MPALSPVTFGFAELNPVTEPVILPVPRLTVVWPWSMPVSRRRSEKAKILFISWR
jgi:hypothetical protein